MGAQTAIGQWNISGCDFIALFVFLSGIFTQWIGFHMAYFLSQLQTIDGSLYEAAKIDGASSLTVITKITLPIMRPAITFVFKCSTWFLFFFPMLQMVREAWPKHSSPILYDQIFSQQFRIGKE